MKIDFSILLVTLSGEPLTKSLSEDEQDEKKEKIQYTLGLACSNALVAFLEQDRQKDGAYKFSCWQLASRISKAKEPIDITAEEIVLIKDRVGRMYGAMGVGPVYELLEDLNKPKE